MNHSPPTSTETTPLEDRPSKLQKRENQDATETGQSNGDNDTKDTQVLTFLEFYSGVGGWGMALEAAVKRISEESVNSTNEAATKISLQCLASMDHSYLCNQVYEYNLRKEKDKHSTWAMPTATSIEKLALKKMEDWKADIWVMSPPCQPHTRQHSNQEADLEDPRSKSFLHLCDLIEKMMDSALPQLILLENVVGFEESNSYKQFRLALAKRNYWAGHFHLSPTQVGLPNDRPRHFCVAVRLQESEIDNEQPLIKYVQVEKEDKIESTNCKIQTSLTELGVTDETCTKDLNDIPCISEFLHANENANLQLKIPDKILSSNSCWCFDIVAPKDHRSSCFTQSYGRYVRGTGSVIYFGSLSQDENGNDQQVFKLVPPEEREFDKDWAKGLDLKNGMRYFSGMEMASLFDFSESFSFPEDCTLKQQWKLLGNSLNVRVAARMSELGIRLFLSKRK